MSIFVPNNNTMKLQTSIYVVLAACISCLFLGCAPEVPEGDANLDETYSDIPEILLHKESPRALMGLALNDLETFSFVLGGKSVQPQVDEDGKWILQSADDDYSEMMACCEDAQLPFGGAADDKLAKLPYSLFYETVVDVMKSYPLFAKQNKFGNYALKDGFAMLKLNLTGASSINSIKVRSLNGQDLSADGLDFVVLNCIKKEGVPVSLPATFMIPVKSGYYEDLEITICDSQRQMKRMSASLPAFGPGETKTINIAYVPDHAVLFYEGFNNCVWGADPVNDEGGYAPDADDPGDGGRTKATGYEDSYSLTGFAGTGLIQTNSDIESEFDMTPFYIKSRGFDNWKYLLRTKEYQGCVGVGVGYKSRGWVQTPNLTNVVGSSDVIFSFRYKVADNANEGIEVKCFGTGAFKNVSLDGGEKKTASGTSYLLDSLALLPGWHKIELMLSNVSSTTSLRVGGYAKKDVSHGFFIDDITVRKANAHPSEIAGISELATLSTVELSFNFKFDELATKPLKVSLPTGGFFTGMKVDGRVVKDKETNKQDWLLRSECTINSDDFTKESHEVVFTVESADMNMTLGLEGNECVCSDLAVNKISSIEKKENYFRVLLWNIQFGMWADQGNDYDNFVAWLKKYDADCCVFVEAETAYKTGSSAPETTIAQKKLNGSDGGSYSYGGKNGWAALASRYGHNSVATSADVDNYSQEITSKTQIYKVLDMHETGDENKPVHHGSGYFTITVGGRKINIVTYHAMPYNYDPKYEQATDKEKEESASKREGDAYRLHEVEYILNQTVNNSKYSSESNWLFLGDMNSHSPVDMWYYKYSEASTIWDAQKYIRENSGLYDIMAEKYPGRFMATTMNYKYRIDYIYASDAMMKAVKNAVVIRDKWTSEKPSGVKDWTSPSDHRPILVDFEF